MSALPDGLYLEETVSWYAIKFSTGKNTKDAEIIEFHVVNKIRNNLIIFNIYNFLI